ncbi:MAG: hypothetical protein AAFX78_14175, partial [Cyanobacteria bacterium J06638_20]
SSRKLSGRWCHRSKFTVSIVICPTGLDVQFSLPALVKNSSSQDGRGLYRQQSNSDLWAAITTIQNRCQFYSYEVWQAAMQRQEVAEQEVGQGDGQTTTVVNIETLHAPNSAINLGGTVKGNQMGTQGESPNP